MEWLKTQQLVSSIQRLATTQTKSRTGITKISHVHIGASKGRNIHTYIWETPLSEIDGREY